MLGLRRDRYPTSRKQVPTGAILKGRGKRYLYVGIAFKCHALLERAAQDHRHLLGGEELPELLLAGGKSAFNGARIHQVLIEQALPVLKSAHPGWRVKSGKPVFVNHVASGLNQSCPEVVEHEVTRAFHRKWKGDAPLLRNWIVKHCQYLSKLLPVGRRFNPRLL